MAIIGPKCSICCTLLSAWGLIMLPIMGGLFWVQSIAFVEDFGEPEHLNHNATAAEQLEELNDKYAEWSNAAAYNCWVACVIYAVTFVFSLWQWYVNYKQAKI